MQQQTDDDRARIALISRIERDYDLVSESLEFGDLRLTFHRVADPDKVFNDMVAEEEQQGQLPWQPYWAEAWYAAETLCRALLERPVQGRRVMDLGCGLGLPGSVAAALGAQVVMVDVAPPSLLFARLNAWPWRQRVATLCLDWSRDSIEGPPFDWILGSDITYDRKEWPHLEPFLRRHLAPGGRVLLVDPFRRVADEFIEWLSNCGWTHEQWTRTDAQQRRIRLLEARHPASRSDDVR